MKNMVISCLLEIASPKREAGQVLAKIMLTRVQASTLTQNVTGPVGPVTPRIYWS